MKLLLTAVLGTALTAFSAETLNLEQAEAMAIQNHPRIASAKAEADVADAAADIVGARQKLQLSGGLTGSVADHGSRQGIGGVNAPDLFTRLGVGVTLSQLVTDFGRSSLATESARENAEGSKASAVNTESEIRLQVRVAYFRALQAQSAHAIAAEVRKSREVLLRQVRTLAENELRSTLDVGFAEVRLSESDLLLVRTENDRASAFIALARTLGLNGPRDWTLDEPALANPIQTVDEAIPAAIQKRPDIVALQHRIQSARKQLQSDNRLHLPTIEAVGLGGFIPAGDPRIQPRYGGLAINLNLPILNGSAFSAQQRQSAARLRVLENQYKDLVLQVDASVRTLYLAWETARKSIEASRRLQEQAERTLRLSEARYTAGLGTIVEFTQAQVDAASAQIGYAVARYEAGLQLSRLEFEQGNLQ